jgi:glycosyl transferase family 25
MKVFVINLKRSKDRWKSIQSECKKHSLIPYRIDAIDGQLIDDSKLNFWDKNLFPKGAIGCRLSHIKAWKTLIEHGDPYSLILEDDCIFVDDFESQLNKIKNEKIFKNNQWDFIYLGYLITIFNFFCYPLNNYYSGYIKNDSLFIPRNPVGLHSYLITRKCALFLLRNLNKVNLPIDLSLISILKDNKKVYASKKILSYQPTDSSSSIITDSKYMNILNLVFSNFEDQYKIKYSFYLSYPILTLFQKFSISGYQILFLCMILLIRSDLILSFLYGIHFVDFILLPETRDEIIKNLCLFYSLSKLKN